MSRFIFAISDLFCLMMLMRYRRMAGDEASMMSGRELMIRAVIYFIILLSHSRRCLALRQCQYHR